MMSVNRNSDVDQTRQREEQTRSGAEMALLPEQLDERVAGHLEEHVGAALDLAWSDSEDFHHESSKLACRAGNSSICAPTL